MKRRRLLLWLGAAALLLAVLLAGAFWPAVDNHGGLHNTLTAQEIDEGWTLLFDGETTPGWQIEGEATVKDGLLNLGGRGPALAQTTESFDNFELNFQYRFEMGQEAMLELGQAGSAAGYGIGNLTSNPHAWNQAILRSVGGTLTVECRPVRVSLISLFGISGIVQGTGSGEPVFIAFKLATAGNKLLLRDLKLKLLNRRSP